MPVAISMQNILIAKDKKVILFDREGKTIQEFKVPEPVVNVYINDHSSDPRSQRLFYLVTERGRLYTFGDSQNGLLGVEETGPYINEPQLVDKKIGIVKQIKFAPYHIVLLNNKGEMYGAGINVFDQLGFEFFEALSFEKFNLEQFGPVKQIACGYRSTLALTENNQLIEWGADSGTKPRLINLPNNTDAILTILSNRYTNYIVTKNHVYIPSKGNRTIYQPLDFLSFKGIINITASSDFCIAQSKEENFFGWGHLPFEQWNTEAKYALPINAKAMHCFKSGLLMLTQDYEVRFIQKEQEKEPHECVLPEGIKTSLEQVVFNDYFKSKEQVRNNLYSSLNKRNYTDLFFTHAENTVFSDESISLDNPFTSL
ncbi:RCC1 domain-containing protein [Legionella saoudiensis]|uniref:hypothetical protein n=1 Tax=Legionella saoudiensis TaxID=1750561 RepID=UPI000730B58C|nr:hypothetical protein [Legionella saoudiensis]